MDITGLISGYITTHPIIFTLATALILYGLALRIRLYVLRGRSSAIINGYKGEFNKVDKKLNDLKQAIEAKNNILRKMSKGEPLP